MKFFNRVLYKISGNRFVQKTLQETILFCLKIMGIGSGDTASASGEKIIFSVLAHRNKPPYCIFDVGANKGQFLSLALKSISIDNFFIHCFEPGKTTFKLLTENSKNDSRIKLNNIGLGKEQGEMTLHYTHPGSVLASLTKRRLDHFNMDVNQSETVLIETIDNYCFLNSIKKIHLLKLDVEGHELYVLAGAQRMLDENAIDMISFEFGGCNIDTHTFFQEFWYFFLNINMQIFRITPSGYLYPIKQYEEIHEQFTTTNFLALRKS